MVTFDSETSEAREPQGSDRGRQDGATRVLLVDDSELALESIGWHLQHWGYVVQSAGNGEEALKHATQAEWDLFVLDVEMPHMNGLELQRRLAELAPSTPVVMLSSHVQSELVLQAVREGAFDYVIKDADLGPLRAAIEGALDDARMRRMNDALLVQLRSTNNVLEQQVALRTEQLVSTNRRLSRERAELGRALRALEEAQQQLSQSEKLAALGVLTAGIAHEINNPLAFLQTNLEFVAQWSHAIISGQPSDTLEYSSDVPSMIEDCLVGLERIRNITRELGIFSRRSDGRTGPVDVKAVIDSVMRLVGSEMRHRAKVTVRADVSRPALANEAELRQVILNLLINAGHAIDGSRDDGHIVIEAVEEGECVVMRVADNGCGIPSEVLPKVFDPFFSTKPIGTGTGLGLPISQQLMRKMEGSIDVQSTEHVGTTVTLKLRAGEVEAAMADVDASPRPAAAVYERGVRAEAGVRRRLLLVDDEPAFLRSMRRMLSDTFDVVTCGSGARALAHIAENGPPDAIISDLMMPEMTGWELFEAVRAKYPELARRFAIVTGGAVTAEAQTFVRATSVLILSKPFAAEELGRVVSSLVATPSA